MKPHNATWAEHFDAMTDEEARDHFATLCTERFGKSWGKRFQEHAGLKQVQTVYKWQNESRPQTWALVLMQEWKDGQRNALIVKGLAQFKALLDAS